MRHRITAEKARIYGERPSLREYLAIAIVVAAGIVSVGWASTLPQAPAELREIVIPMIAMFALTSAVWLLMVIARNIAVLLGAVSVKYFHDYGDGAPDEWIERPARTFNNLMQAPTLFYVVALLVIVLHSVDASQVSLAWIYVASRAVHATIYIVFNYVPLRFASYAVSCIALAAMWARLALSL
jgi:hypothetical protein